MREVPSLEMLAYAKEDVVGRDYGIDTSLAREMGWRREDDAGRFWWIPPDGGEELREPPNLTDSGEGLLLVLRWMADNGYNYDIDASDGEPRAEIYDQDRDHEGVASATTLPLAVAKALLRAVK